MEKSSFQKKHERLYEGVHVESYRELLESCANRFGDAPAFCFKKDPKQKEPEFIQISYQQHKNEVEAFSSKLLDLGLEGKPVALISPNRYVWPVSYMAITTGNMIVVPLDYLLPTSEIESLLIRSKAEAVIFDPKYLSFFEELAQKVSTSLRYFICMDPISEKTNPNFYDYPSLLQEGKELLAQGKSKYAQVTVNPEQMSIMLFTSGTTGNAKAVMLSQKGICSNFSAVTTILRRYPKDRVLSFLPLHHTFECTATYLYSYLNGWEICYSDGIKNIPKNLVEYHITGMVCVPAVLEIMARQIKKTIRAKGLTIPFTLLQGLSAFLLFFHIDIRRKFFSSILNQLGGGLRIIIFGSAPADKKVIRFFESIGIDMLQGYGLTETSPVISCQCDDRRYRKIGSCGLPLYNQEVKILEPDEHGVGEILVKGPNVMLGYYENEEATNESFIDGYFRTGDLGYLDKKGFLYVTGRKKDVIVLNNGKNIFPQELEDHFNESDFITESFVFADRKKDSETKLCVKFVYDPALDIFQGKSESEIEELILQDFQKRNQMLPGYKQVKHVILTTTPLIRTTTQKIKRHEEELLCNGKNSKQKVVL